MADRFSHTAEAKEDAELRQTVEEIYRKGYERGLEEAAVGEDLWDARLLAAHDAVLNEVDLSDEEMDRVAAAVLRASDATVRSAIRAKKEQSDG